MRVRLGDDADARPSGVREHRSLRGLRPQREVQEVIVANLRAQSRGVVAQLTDLGGGLVDEGQISVRGADGARHEEGIRVALRDQTSDRGIVEVKTVAGHQDV